MEKRYAVGIDLGTSNSAIALTGAEADASIEVVPVPQLLSFQALGERNTLPSALYLPASGEAESVSAKLPWQPEASTVDLVGEFAREHGALVPDRLVTSAKSWLCNPHVDPAEPILPWKAELGERMVSPLGASTRYLNHLFKALELNLSQGEGGFDPAECELVVTVPASFDEVARIHTHEAAEAAGLGEVTLLEEQQAAFYHWISQSEGHWREQVQPGDVVLICDVGGGTADFSLVAVAERDGELHLERISVGDHILLGGDNMDLALAYAVRAELDAKGQKIDNWQFLSLVHGCRLGKEKLFADSSLNEFPISLPSRGSGLFAGMISAALRRETLQQVVLEGFFPVVGVHEHPQRRRQVGLQEFGLEYAADPCLSKHLAYFLARSWQNAQSNPELSALVSERVRESQGAHFICPTAVLFNGGVFKAEPVRQRVLELLELWNDGVAVQELTGSHFDLAVSKGAAHYARTLMTGEGIRIKSGTARSYYIGLETSMPAVPGLVPPIKAVCVVPQGMEEGTEAALEGQQFGLVTGEPVEFRFFSSSVRAGDEVGSIVDDESELEETACLEVNLPAQGDRAGELVPVELHSVVTELGTLELWMRHEPSGQQWKVEFNVRPQ